MFKLKFFFSVRGKLSRVIVFIEVCYYIWLLENVFKESKILKVKFDLNMNCFF